jgi:uncharacterized membrane protein
MTQPSPLSTSAPSRGLLAGKPWIAPVLLVLGAVVILALRPNLRLLAEASPVIRLHVAVAAGAVVLGALQMGSRKGAAYHRIAGWAWVVLMTTVAASSLFITELTPGRWSLIHLLSGWTLISIPVAMIAARRHNVRLHRRFMMGLFFGGLLIAGALTFIPGRLMWRVFFGG